VSRPQQYATLPLKVLRRDSQDEYHIYLVMTVEDDEHHPVELGTGRNAVVFLGSSTANLQSVSQEYYAVKFLKDDPDKEYARVTEDRFFYEATITHSCSHLGDSFVKYNSWGALSAEIDKPVSDVWVKFFGERINAAVNTGEPYTAILQSYYLQGPFYTIELCQATLYDLLDRNTPWLKLPVYDMQPPRAEGLHSYTDALNQTAQSLEHSINWIASQYMTGCIYGKSGYDILNTFKDEPKANQVRNYTVLELFAHIVRIVRALHSHPRKLAHRDLKPGNVFIAHDANFDGIKTISVKLGDLGYIAQLSQLNTTNFSLGYGIQNPAAMALGSQFYRAPEQAELPIEVRISFEKDTSNTVQVYSSKMSNIQVGDRLVIGDPFKKSRRRRSTELTDQDVVQTVFKINEVVRDNNHIVGFVLDGALTIDKTEDISAHVVRATGYHTDGYSLGAILYDLASGGRNPETFYIYCLARFIEEFSHVKYSVGDIIEALVPSESHHEIAHSPAQTRPIRVVSELLTDQRGVPIPCDIIRIIIKCMLRNIDGDVDASYYSSSPEKGFLGDRNIWAVERIHHDTQNCLNNTRNQLPHNFPHELKGDLLFKLRSMAPAHPVELELPTQPQLAIFLCHVIEDRERVLDLRRKLHNLQFSTWEFGQIRPGEKWQHSIQKEIEKADIFIACLSHNFVSKQSYAQREIEYALRIAEKRPTEQIYIIPLRLDTCTVPDHLSIWQWVDYFDGSEPEQLVQVLRTRADEVISTKYQQQITTPSLSSQKSQIERIDTSSIEVDHLKELITTYRSALAILHIQVARLGEAFAPPGKVQEIKDLEKKVQRIKKRMYDLGIPYTDEYMDISDDL
jgi:serine/threonine protein kinase